MIGSSWTRDRLAAAVQDEYLAFAAHVHDLSQEALDTPTRCAGWTVRAVAGHVLGTAIDITENKIGQRDPDQQAQAYQQWPAGRLSAALAKSGKALRTHLDGLDEQVWGGPVYGVPGQQFSTGVLTLLHELCVHTDDIDVALRESRLSPRLIEASVQWLISEFTRLHIPPITLHLDGHQPVSGGSEAPQINTDALTFIRVATGRAEPELIGLDSSINIYGRDRGHVGV